MAFPRAKRLTRLRQIAQVMIKHGLGFLLVQAGLGHLVPRLARRPTNRGVELRGALEELGPTFVKLGQALSTRRDLLPPDVVKELEGLQDRAPSFPLSQVKEVIAAELGHPLDELFSYFSPEPLAAASIGQVHLARLPDGREVAVKVQRPGIVDQVEVDLAILAEVAALVESRTSWGRAYGLREQVQEFARTIRAELDYVTEAEHCRRFARNCTGDPEVRIPQVLTDLSAHR
ncbi:MAG TPA: ABC transporter, partial [Firmicutes bacterium]|nr:ABC transporter [Bacillota bacterium]